MASLAHTPRSSMDRKGVMRWRCSQCAVYRQEHEMVWGLADGTEEWPPWRVICRHCTLSADGQHMSPRGGRARTKQPPSPRRLAPLVQVVQMDLKMDDRVPAAPTLPRKEGGAAARRSSHLRHSEVKRSRDRAKHALVTYRADGFRPQGSHLLRPPVVTSSRLRGEGKSGHAAASKNGAEEEEEEGPPPGGHHPQIFFAPKLERLQLRTLLEETNMTRTELYRLFNRFKALCQLSGTPGSINKKTFKEGVSSLAFEDDAFVDRVFGLLDEDGSGTVEWEEFVNTVNALETGSPHDKLSFCFQVYDRDGNASIERGELHDMFTSMLQAGMTSDDDMSDELKELIDDFVNSIYDSIDADRSGSLEFEEVLDAIQRRKITDVWEIFGRTLVSHI